MERLERVLKQCAMSRTMYGLVFITDNLNPLSRKELEEVITNLETKYKHKSFHYLCEQTGLMTSYNCRGNKTPIRQLSAEDVNYLSLKYEVHTGFNPESTKTRLPNFYSSNVYDLF